MVPFLPDRLLRWPAVLLSAAAFCLLICSALLLGSRDGVFVVSPEPGVSLTRLSKSVMSVPEGVVVTGTWVDGLAPWELA